ncbi:hypothetical protein AB4277_16535 [Vibrio splendidus]|uniref:Uncharacterized protein n=1 Tax=Vibrio kanaloae TaxID=170673 RepID=A0A4U1Z1M6_9VIBR|nr:hypothetical protein [Vibrio kanaloae]TKF26301.1 hypothetical protein FCV50_21285 [Vibrio kanaloae]
MKILFFLLFFIMSPLAHADWKLNHWESSGNVKSAESYSIYKNIKVVMECNAGSVKATQLTIEPYLSYDEGRYETTIWSYHVNDFFGNKLGKPKLSSFDVVSGSERYRHIYVFTKPDLSKLNGEDAMGFEVKTYIDKSSDYLNVWYSLNGFKRAYKTLNCDGSY